MVSLLASGVNREGTGGTSGDAKGHCASLRRRELLEASLSADFN